MEEAAEIIADVCDYVSQYKFYYLKKPITKCAITKEVLQGSNQQRNGNHLSKI